MIPAKRLSINVHVAVKNVYSILCESNLQKRKTNLALEIINIFYLQNIIIKNRSYLKMTWKLTIQLVVVEKQLVQFPISESYEADVDRDSKRQFS